MSWLSLTINRRAMHRAVVTAFLRPGPRPASPHHLTPRPSGARHVTRRLAAECRVRHATATEIERTQSRISFNFTKLSRLFCCLPVTACLLLTIHNDLRFVPVNCFDRIELCKKLGTLFPKIKTSFGVNVKMV